MGLRFGLLGAGRIGTGAREGGRRDRRGRSWWRWPTPIPEAAEAIAKSYAAEVRSVEAIMNAKDVDAVLITTPTDLHARDDRTGGAGGKGDLLRKADRSFGRSGATMPRGGARRESRADDRLQSSLRPEFHGSAGPHRRRRHRRSGDGVDHLARSRAAARRLCGALGRPVPRHDDP